MIFKGPENLSLFYNKTANRVVIPESWMERPARRRIGSWHIKYARQITRFQQFCDFGVIKTGFRFTGMVYVAILLMDVF